MRDDRVPTHSLQTVPVQRFRWSDGWEWAVILLDDTAGHGAVYILSSWGSWTHAWPARNRGERFDTIGKFIVGCDFGYLCSKFAPKDEEDWDATKERVKRHILEMRRTEQFTKERAREEYDLVTDKYAMTAVSSAEAWCAETRIDDYWEFVRRVPSRAFTHFYKHVWKALVAELRSQESHTTPSEPKQDATGGA